MSGYAAVLRRRRCPEWSLHPRAACRQGVPAPAGELLLELVVGELALRHGRGAAQRQGLGRADRVEPAVDLGVDATDEERRHRRHVGQVAGTALEPGDVGLHHGLVAFEAEDERDVDAPPLADHLLDRADALRGGGDLHVEVRLVDQLVEVTGGRLGAESVTGEAGIDLDRHVPVDAVGLVVDGAQDRQRIADVGDHEVPVGLLDRDVAAGHELVELRVVVVAGLHRLLEDRRVRGDAPHPSLDPSLHLTRGDPSPLEVVEPRALALLGVEVLQSSHVSFLPRRAAPALARRRARV